MNKEKKLYTKDIKINDDKNKQTSVLRDIQKHTESESDHFKTSELLMNEKFKRRKSVLVNHRQVGLITTLDVIAQMYDIPFLKNYIDWYLELLTSIGGAGRKDIVDISKFRFEERDKLNNQLLQALGHR